MSSKYDVSTQRLVAMSKEGDAKAFSVLVAEYSFLIRERAKAYLYSGIELEDLYQEGTIGFLKAVLSFDSSNTASFKTFALLCVDRNIISAVNKVFAKSNVPKNAVIHIDDVNEKQLISPGCVENEVLTKIDIANLFDEVILGLSKFERLVFEQFIKGYSYSKIAQILDVQEKSVDNAIQRIRRKLAK